MNEHALLRSAAALLRRSKGYKKDRDHWFSLYYTYLSETGQGDTQIREVAATVAVQYGLSIVDIEGNGKRIRPKANVAWVRHVVFWVLHLALGITTAQIGRVLYRDHTSVGYGVRRVEEKRMYEGVNAELQSHCAALQVPCPEVKR